MDIPVTNAADLRRRNSTSDRSILPIPGVIKLGYRLASLVSPKLAAEIARQVFFRPPRAAYRDEHKLVLTYAQRVSMTVRGEEVQVYAWGEGPVVALLHGWGGHAGQMTEFVTPLTKAGFRVIAIDAPGHGRSGGRLSSIVHFARALEAVATTFGPLHAVIAHSLGAASTVQAMAKGLPVKRLVFVAPQARLVGYWQLFRQTLGMSDEAWRIMRVRTERWLKVRYEQLHPVDIAPRMSTPLLILHGEADRMTPFTEGETLARFWPRAEFRPLDCGHIAILRDWRTLLASVDFIKFDTL
jgi:pimeloyl-ACP methyl ester carboxylesterase